MGPAPMLLGFFMDAAIDNVNCKTNDLEKEVDAKIARYTKKKE
jgi:hypothetical protein